MIRFVRCRLALMLGITLVLWTATVLVRISSDLRSGLRAQYFATSDVSGPVVRDMTTPTLSTPQLSRDWRYAPPDDFSARWAGWVFVTRPGEYTMVLTSDGGSVLYVDGQRVVDNTGQHRSITRTGEVALGYGAHAVALEYSSSHGAYGLEWSWRQSQEPIAPISDWLRSPKRRTLPSLMAIRLLEWCSPLLACLSLWLCGALAVQRGDWPRREEGEEGEECEARRAVYANRSTEYPRAAATLALFVLLTVVQTWPLARDPAHLSRNNNADTVLNEWSLAWISHQFPRHPLALFDGNMFYPEHRTLAYSEALVVQGVMASPVLWLGASPVLAYNIILMAGFAFTGWAMCLVITRWTGDWAAGLSSGIILAFNAHVLTRLPHLQAQHVEFLPLVLCALDAVLRRPRWRTAAWLALWFTLQALTSVYLAVFTVVAVLVAFLVRPEDWVSKRFKTVAPKLLAAAGLASAALAAFFVPYWRLHGEGFVRSLDEVQFYAATARDYLTTPSRLYSWAGGATALFPGAVAVMLAAVAVGTRRAFVDRRARMCLAFGAIGVFLSFGPAVVPGYEFLYSTLPLLQGIKTSARFGYLGIVAVAVLGGYGLAWLRQKLADHLAWRNALTAVALALVFLEPLSAPLFFAPFDHIRDIYRIPAATPNAVVVELPMAPPDSQLFDAPYLLNSTLNWKPLLNGFSGFTPASSRIHYAAARTFPSRTAVDALRGFGVTHVFIHQERFSPAMLAAIDREPALHELAREASIVLYRLDANPRTP